MTAAVGTAARTTLSKVRLDIERRIGLALIEQGKATLELAMRDVEVGRLLNEGRATWTDGTTKEQADAFNKWAARVTSWSYSQYRRVMAAATTADRNPGAAEKVNGSVHALEYLARFEKDHADAIIAAAGPSPTRAKLVEAAPKVVESLRVSASDKAKKERDAAKRREHVIASTIAKDLAKVLRASEKFPPEVRVAMLAFGRQCAKWGAAHGPLTSKVISDSARALEDHKKVKDLK